MRSIYRQFGITDEVLDYAAPVLEKLTERFRQIDEVAEYNQLRVIKAMQDAHIGEANLKVRQVTVMTISEETVWRGCTPPIFTRKTRL